MPHSGEAFAFRVGRSDGAGRGVVYSGDCADADALLPLLRPGDTLLAEATFGAGPVPAGMPHLDGPAAARVATAAGAGALLLTHVRMGCDPAATVRSAAEHYEGPVTRGRTRRPVPGVRPPDLDKPGRRGIASILDQVGDVRRVRRRCREDFRWLRAG